MRRISILLLSAMMFVVANAKTTTLVQFSTTSDKLIVTAVWSYEITSLYGSQVAVVTGVSPTTIGALTVPAVMIDNMETPGDDSDDVPYPVKYVGAYAFANHLGMTSVTLPETLIEVGDGAFKNCNSLQTVSLNSGLQRIGKRPFENTSLTTLILPYTLKTMDGNIVAGCETFESFTIESSLYFALADGALYDKRFKKLYSCPAGVTTLRIQASTQEIGDEAFANCQLLDAIEIPQNVTKIGSGVFADCEFLTALTFDGNAAPQLADDNLLADTDMSLVVLVPDESTGWFTDAGKDTDFPLGRSWPENADPNNQRLIKRESSSIEYSCNYASVGNVIWSYRVVNGKAELYGENGAVAAIHESTAQTYTFDASTGAWTPDGVLNIPDELDGYSVTSIGSNAFLNCSALTAIVIPDSITTIGDFAFKGCTATTEIELPARIFTIGYHPFEGTSLTTLALPDNLRTLRGNPAAGCETLLFYSLSANNSYFAVSDNVLYDADYETLISCPARRPSVSIPSTVRTIGAEALRGCCRLAVISLPEILEKAESEAFVGCSRLQELSFSSNLTALAGDGLFAGCSNLMKVSFAGNAPTVSSGLLADTPAALTVHVNAGTTGWKDASASLPDDALWPVGGTTRRTIICDTIVVDPYETSGNWKYQVADGVAEISGTVVKPTGAVTIPDELNGYPVKSIAAQALANCLGITSIVLPSSISEIGANAFSGCDVLKSVALNYGLRQIGYAVFAGTALQTLSIPATVTNIVGNPVIGCDMMQNVTVESGSHAYAATEEGLLLDAAQTKVIGCPAIADTITLPATVTELEDDAFADCRSLEEITFLGNAPACADTVFANTPADLELLVSVNSTGWSVAIPGTWRGRTINYIDYVDPALVYTTADGWSYHILNEYEAEIWSGNTNAISRTTSGAVVIPESVDGYVVTSIGTNALKNLKLITSIEIPAYVEQIAEGALSGCTRLETITVDAENIDFISQDGVLYDYMQETLLLCPARIKSLTVPSTVTSLAADALADCSVLEKVTFEGNAPTLHDDLYAATPEKLITAVAADTTGWLDTSIALPADGLWPVTGTRRTIVRDVNVESASSTINCVTWTYSIEGGEAIITGVEVDDYFEGTLTIPSTLGGCYVTDVTSDAFNDVEGVSGFAVATDNIGFSVRNGVLYSANGATLVRVPNAFKFAASTTTVKKTITTTVSQRAEDGFVASAYTTNKVSTTEETESIEPTLTTAELFAGVVQIADGAFTGCGNGGTSTDPVSTTNSTKLVSSDSGITDGHTWATVVTAYEITETTVQYVEKLVVPGGVSYSRTRAFAGANFTDVEEEAPQLMLATSSLPDCSVVSLVCPTVEDKVYTVWKTEKLGGSWTKVAEFSGSGEAVEFIDANQSSSAFYKVTSESAR